VALDDWERRPIDEAYYAERTEYVRLGDVFRDVPLGYPLPAEALDHTAGERKFLAGPFEPGFGMLVTPTCSFFAQGESGYAHPVRTLAPVLPLDELVEKGAVKKGALDDLRTHDHLINYFYLPPIAEVDMPESLALLYAGMTLHHDYLEERRVAQLSEEAAVHLKYKLAALAGGTLFSHENFSDEIT
jgi:hypothetical protein